MINLNTIFWGNTIQQWLIAFTAVLISFGILMLVKHMVITRLKKFTQKTTTEVDDFLIHLFKQTKDLFFLALGIYVGMRYLVLVDQVMQTARVVVLLVLFLQIGFWANSLVNFWISQQVQHSVENGRRDANKYSVLGLIVKGVIWSVVLLLILDNIPGINVDTLIASLGITGIAVGLAVQNILGDLFASLSIALDKPFVIGDTIVVGDLIGKIEKIGLKSTRLRSISGEQLIFSNSDLLSSRIHNYQSMQRRRVSLQLEVDYHTPIAQLEQIPTMAKTIVEQIDQVSLDRAHLSKLSDYSIVFEVIVFIESADYNLYMDIQQKILLAVLRKFEVEGIQIPFPTHTIYSHSNSSTS